MKIDPHDVDIRVNQARRFLFEGHKVQIVQNFRGREVMHKDRGDLRMKEIVQKLSDVGKLEVPPRLMGRRMTMILAPDRAKVEQAKQRQAAATHASAGHSEEPVAPEEPVEADAIEAGPDS
jgi:translation initiation factor IF-3